MGRTRRAASRLRPHASAATAPCRRACSRSSCQRLLGPPRHAASSARRSGRGIAASSTCPPRKSIREYRDVLGDRPSEPRASRVIRIGPGRSWRGVLARYAIASGRYSARRALASRGALCGGSNIRERVRRSWSLQNYVNNGIKFQIDMNDGIKIHLPDDRSLGTPLRTSRCEVSPHVESRRVSHAHSRLDCCRFLRNFLGFGRRWTHVFPSYRRDVAAKSGNGRHRRTTTSEARSVVVYGAR